jgi:uncharacterized protein
MADGFFRYLKEPQWQRQHGWRKAVWNGMARMGMTGMHALPVNRRWVDIHRRKMPMQNLDPALIGLKIVQISDLHYSPVVWRRYLAQHIRWVNELKPDIIVVTGDLITGGYLFAERVARMLEHLAPRYVTICTFGNHDYGMLGKNMSRHGKSRAKHLESELKGRGLTVLRNQVYRLKPDGAARALTIVGLDDEWSGHIDPKRAFKDVGSEESIICLNHNPANCNELMKYPWQWMLSGHTHGRQVATSRIGKVLYPKRYRHYVHGYYTVSGRHLYVNRGLSYGQRVMHWCKPEVTVFTLDSVNGSEDASSDGDSNGDAL